MLGVVEVGWDGDDIILDGMAKEDLSDLMHLGVDHGDLLKVKHFALPL